MRTAILAMIYHEPEWLYTCGCLSRVRGIPVFFADRNGVEGLAGAFNEGFQRHRLRDFDYVWFLTNVTFQPEVPTALSVLCQERGLAALHPVFESDHTFCRKSDDQEMLAEKRGVTEAPFVEFTAPMVDAKVFDQMPLDGEMPYTGHDVDWGHRVRLAGWKMGVWHGHSVGHTYNRKLIPHPATRHRAQLRKEYEPLTVKRLEKKYGPRWRAILNYQGGI